MFKQLGLIGCGLMGGSFALALKRAGLVERVVGYSKSPSTTETARRMRVIDVEAPSALVAVSGADLVVVAVPVGATEDVFKAIYHMLRPDMLVMDLGSTKAGVAAAAARVLRERVINFVGAHPIAGKESSGVAHADAQLYKGCQVVLTPTEDTLPHRLHQAEQLWQALGCQVHQMSPEAHDNIFSAVSHLPHLVAFALINGVATQANSERFLSLAGPGFRDTTRVAAGDSNMWRDIFLANSQEVLKQSRLFREALAEMEAAIESGNGQALESLLLRANQVRKAWQLNTPTAV